MESENFFLVGFDVRAHWSNQWAQSWDGERRALFLLNETVPRPLSVDRNVWPTLELTENEFSLDNSPAWRDRDHMTRSLSKRFLNWELEADAIAIEVQCPEGELDAELSTQFAAAYDDWRHEFAVVLGYDIADASFTSALSNCGFSSDEKPALQRDFADFINQHGLFSDITMANRYRERSERRIPEHAPFFVYRLRSRKGVVL